MESFGSILREKREEKNITIEVAARETVISRQYLEALESENIDVFPGHTYLVGFLNNYSTYLGLDASCMIKLFHGKIIQEAPIPASLLLGRKLTKKTIITIIASASLLLCVAGFCLVYFLIIQPHVKDLASVDLQFEQGQEYTLSSIPFQRRLYIGDRLIVPFAEGAVELTVSDTLDSLVLETPIGLQFVDLGEELEINVDGKNGADIVVFLSDISKTDEKLGAEVRMFFKADTSAGGLLTSVVQVDSIPLDSNLPLEVGVSQKIILADTGAYPFTLNIRFRGDCLFRYQGDRNESIEGFFTEGDDLVIRAQNAIRLWMSNANSVQIQLIAGGRTYDLAIGNPGQVLVQDVRWIREADGTFNLSVLDVD